MIHTRTSNGFTVKVVTDYDAPKKGDKLNVFGAIITLTEDMKPGIDVFWSEKQNKNFAKPVMTNFEKNNVPVFYADGFSWRVTD